MIVIPDTTGSDAALWHALIDLADKAHNWTLIGARMVELHAIEGARAVLRTSLDGDVLADARSRPNAVRRVSEILIAEDFRLDEPSYMGLGHRFQRDGVEIDVLAPEHLGPRSEELRTTVPGAHTVEVPGGRQALARSERVAIRAGERAGSIPRPNLLGAILLKARAVEVDDVPDNQRSDLAILLSLVQDPDALARELGGDERSWLRRRTEMDDPAASGWRALTASDVGVGLSALRVLAGWA